MNKGVVRFHDVHEVPYGVFSPLSPHPIVIRHKQYPSVHHYFLTERFRDAPVTAALRSATSVWELDRLVKEAERTGSQREDWNRVKVDVMLLGNYMKFKQNEAVRSLLLETGDKLIIDHTTSDDFWGDRGDGSGKNLLGVILMAVRDRLRRETATKAREK
ncbi:hypothetical protein C3747_10g328 [Trypanosoma cruzi]|uniref:NADAR domain-containing protein n=2 Tax=Trypanosoma cruzi TaxID=5693 RepID=Q4DND0_TRYCC|nr:hypothetical protein, conserved [Trypanosoma cruzi]EAN94027.1 hypothetical protein, conserved [Trypanosoma cruzi]KAF8303150.1 hypothetical protein TcYC6_0041710 [Trypanosoma cruzi]PWV19523.1 hypothetical protein C3747_10g328 [Trypanosoma cruzi]RNC50162.1 putative GTP cyclohydrolase II [Trypanosoma cruzi]|eukprot:XP_815878.1 hypothetical protein [Trypanosoma cruzi strain CL Brener]